MERELENIHNFSSENDHFYSREKIEENCICVLSSLNFKQHEVRIIPDRYYNTSMQYTPSFNGFKMTFLDEKLCYFSYVCLKHRLLILVRNA